MVAFDDNKGVINVTHPECSSEAVHCQIFQFMQIRSVNVKHIRKQRLRKLGNVFHCLIIELQVMLISRTLLYCIFGELLWDLCKQLFYIKCYHYFILSDHKTAEKCSSIVDDSCARGLRTTETILLIHTWGCHGVPQLVSEGNRAIAVFVGRSCLNIPGLSFFSSFAQNAYFQTLFRTMVRAL